MALTPARGNPKKMVGFHFVPTHPTFLFTQGNHKGLPYILLDIVGAILYGCPLNNN
jgi:hypothetical protein